MLVRVNYLKRHAEVDVGPLFTALTAEVERADVDPTRLAVSLDWVQYKRSFRRPVEHRPFVLPDGRFDTSLEIAVDVRRIGQVELAPALRCALTMLRENEGTCDPRIYLEEFGWPSQSAMWSFNRLYWHYLAEWEATFQRSYLAALPGSASDGMNPVFWRDRLGVFLELLDDLRRRGILPDEIFVVELGVGTGHNSKVWLDTFRELCASAGRDYYERIRYLMSDFSHDLLYSARQTIAEHGGKVSCLNFDVADPLHALSFLRYKALFVHSCNLYDNLPTDELIRHNGKL